MMMNCGKFPKNAFVMHFSHFQRNCACLIGCQFIKIFLGFSDDFQFLWLQDKTFLFETCFILISCVLFHKSAVRNINYNKYSEEKETLPTVRGHTSGTPGNHSAQTRTHTLACCIPTSPHQNEPLPPVDTGHPWLY